MPSRSLAVWIATLCLLSTAVLAQNSDARARLAAAHAQYYTPTASGLKSFHCDASIDWKAMMTRLSGKEIPDENPAMKFLGTVRLSVSDELRGAGSLEWSSPAPPPEDREAAIRQIREGLQTAVAGFFQSWNAYMNGSMVPIPDTSIKITNSGDGAHLSGTTGETSFDEDYDRNMLLTEVRVVNPRLKVVATPSFVSTTDGLVVSVVKSVVNQPPTAPDTQAIFRIDYAKVDSFQLPSHLIFDIRNTGVIEMDFTACHVEVADWAKKRQEP